MSVYPVRLRSPTLQQQNDRLSRSMPARPVLGDRWASTAQLSYSEPTYQRRAADGLNHPHHHSKGKGHIRFDPAATAGPATRASSQPAVRRSPERPVTPPPPELPLSPLVGPVQGGSNGHQTVLPPRAAVNAIPIYSARHYDVGAARVPASPPSLQARPRPLSASALHRADVYGRQLAQSGSTRSESRSQSSQTRPPFISYNPERSFNAHIPRPLRSDVFGYPLPLQQRSARLGPRTTPLEVRSRSVDAQRDRRIRRIPGSPSMGRRNVSTPAWPLTDLPSLASQGSVRSPLTPGQQLETLTSQEGFGTVLAEQSIPIEQQSRPFETSRRIYIPVETCIDALPETSAQEIGWVHNNHVLTKDHVLPSESLRSAEGVVLVRKAVEETGHAAVVAKHIAENQAGDTLLPGYRVVAKHYDPVPAAPHTSRPILLAKYNSRPFSTWHSPAESGVQVDQPISALPSAMPVSLEAVGRSRRSQSAQPQPGEGAAVNPQAVTLRWPVLSATPDGHTAVQGVATNPRTDKGHTVAECLHWYD